MTGPGAKDLDRAVARLARGHLVAFPTETVYGLGADAENPEALELLYRVKGRPSDHPVIVHLGDLDWLDRYAAEIPEPARRLVEVFWPGPLTLILPRTAKVPDQVTGGRPTVGLRMPNHPLALSLLRAYGKGLAAPSANRFGRISPTTAQHVIEDLGEEAMVLDGGPCEVGIESTIVTFEEGHPVVVRPGRISAKEVSRTLKLPVREPSRPVSAPGTLERHYAPNTPTLLVEGEALSDPEAAVWSRRRPASSAHWEPAPTDPVPYAQQLYDTLRRLDQMAWPRILVERPPAGPEWEAIHDRLRRATAGE